MSTLLYITANPKPTAYSQSLQLSDYFIAEYQKNHPDHVIVPIDLYNSPISYLSVEDLQAIFASDKSALASHPVLQYTNQFANADKYVFSFPMWNFGVPAILKAYIDYVSVSGITFRYTENGPQGMLENKKALLVTASGGDYSAPALGGFDHCSTYMRDILGLFGITDTKILKAYNTSIQGFDVDAMMAEKKKEAQALATEF